eukprot:GHVH01003160.1.p1 GENE.GHVH01003160.1~~GHVH01003160.1.p1  ORF type:complete len:518 (+),score=60.08 GHVH01003160.1:563-2116(+)
MIWSLFLLVLSGVYSGASFKQNSEPLDFDASDQFERRKKNITFVTLTSSDWSPYPIYQSTVGPLTQLMDTNQGDYGIDSTQFGFEMRKHMIHTHNYYRSIESYVSQGGPKYMNKIKWDFSLEAYALQWTSYLCLSPGRYFDHSPIRSGYPAWPMRVVFGENLYASSGSNLGLPSGGRNSGNPFDQIDQMLTDFYNEKACYDAASAAAGGEGVFQHCVDEGQDFVGHYTQMVRPEVTGVGCAMVTNCKQSEDHPWHSYLGCQYDYGNTGGLVPYERDYSVKKRHEDFCQHCPSGFDCCQASLCSGGSTTIDFEPWGPARAYAGHDQKCPWKRNDSCANTGSALMMNLSQSGDEFEYNECSCSMHQGWGGVHDIPYKGLFWYRTNCHKLISGNGRRLEDVQSQTPALQTSTIPDTELSRIQSTASRLHNKLTRITLKMMDCYKDDACIELYREELQEWQTPEGRDKLLHSDPNWVDVHDGLRVNKNLIKLESYRLFNVLTRVRDDGDCGHCGMMNSFSD